MMLRKPATRQSWRNKPLPESYVALELDGVISAEHHPLILLGYVPQSQADKWFIFHEDGWLSFHRAQSGTCIFKLEIIPRDDHHLAERVLVNRDKQQYRSIDDSYDVQLMAYLIDRYLLGRNPPFPQPGRLNKDHRGQHQQHVVGEAPKSQSNGFVGLDDLLNNH